MSHNINNNKESKQTGICQSFICQNFLIGNLPKFYSAKHSCCTVLDCSIRVCQFSSGKPCKQLDKLEPCNTHCLHTRFTIIDGKN